LYGIGGIGKSRICSEYAHEHETAYSTIFWINASTPAELATSALDAVEQIINHYIKKPPGHNAKCPQIYQRIALDLGVHNSSINDCQELLAAVIKRSAIEVLKNWLSEESNDKWLLVIDDYDNSYSQSHRLKDILPTRGVGHVLVTTRKSIAGQHNPIHIEKIGEKDGIELLKTLTQLDG
ncbi:hypothetical protein BDD12DRAFT_739641, partial [Trichophaea hybrida]